MSDYPARLTGRYSQFGNYRHPLFSGRASNRRHLWYKIAKHLADWFTVVSTDLRVTAEDREAHATTHFAQCFSTTFEVIW
jgi:hypothetical protein